MLILTEKPSVAKDFAKALGCSFSSYEKVYKSPDGKTVITNCMGHLYDFAKPEAYNPDYISWTIFPVIPEKFIYRVLPHLKGFESKVITLLRKNKDKPILIATDADREGEIIARECLLQAGITDFSKIKRFWVSQALIPEVIREGISNAKPLQEYNFLSEQGFARQKADWIVGMNVGRYLKSITGKFTPVGRVAAALLSEIDKRCEEVSNFKKEKYYTFLGNFTSEGKSLEIKGTYCEEGNTRFKDSSGLEKLKLEIGKNAECLDIQKKEKSLNPPQLYSLTDLQQDAFNQFGYTANKTLEVLQFLYEKQKCISYPRTPSRVLGNDNVELCRSLVSRFLSTYPKYNPLKAVITVNGDNKRVFDSSKLESHHAIIPLSVLPANASEDEQNIYQLILDRFLLSFAPQCRIETVAVKLKVGDKTFIVNGRRTFEEGWKKYCKVTEDENAESEGEQDISEINWDRLCLNDVEAIEKYTRPPKLYNEAAILKFMENPKDNDGSLLTGIGTPATRHIFIPKLIINGYVKREKKNLYVTEEGKKLLKVLKDTAFTSLTDIGETTEWEKKLSENPEKFLFEIEEYVRKGVEAAAL